MVTVASKMTALANEVREISGATNKLSIDAMTTYLDTVNTEVANQESLIADMNEVLDNLGAESVGGSSVGAVETCYVHIGEGASVTFFTYIDAQNNGAFVKWNMDTPDAPPDAETYNKSFIAVKSSRRLSATGGQVVDGTTALKLIYVNPGAGNTCTISAT